MLPCRVETSAAPAPVKDDDSDHCDWILVQEWVGSIPGLFTKLEMEKGLTLIVRSSLDYGEGSRFPDIILSPVCGIFILSDPSCSPDHCVQLYLANYSRFRKLWFVFLENCTEQYTYGVAVETLASGIDTSLDGVNCPKDNQKGYG